MLFVPVVEDMDDAWDAKELVTDALCALARPAAKANVNVLVNMSAAVSENVEVLRCVVSGEYAENSLCMMGFRIASTPRA